MPGGHVPVPPFVRLMKKTKEVGECVVFTGRVGSDGYGRIKVGSSANGGKIRTVGVHIVAAEQYFGPRPDGLEVCHKCDNRLCVRADHLYYGTHKQNIRDSVDRGRHVCCKRQKEYSEVSMAIGEMLDSGKSRDEVAISLGVCSSLVARVARKRGSQFHAWKRKITPIVAKEICDSYLSGIPVAVLAAWAGCSARAVRSTLAKGGVASFAV